jgi:hypothetical protein
VTEPLQPEAHVAISADQYGSYPGGDRRWVIESVHERLSLLLIP